MNVLVIIPARGGSKGIPRKNLRALAGRPLISYSIRTALASKFSPDVYVSSEDDEILSISRSFGARIVRRDASIAADATTLDPVIYDAYRQAAERERKTYDFIVTLQPTSPLLKTQSLDEALSLLLERPEIETVISAKDDTHLTWKKIGQEFLPNYEKRVNRQYLTPVYRETGGFLITRARVISEHNRIGGKVHLHLLSKGEEVDIDTYEDWNICEYYLRRKKILFVVTGNPEVGLGHVYNTLLLANDILNHQIEFLVDNKSRLAYDKIALKNYPVYMQQHPRITEDILARAPQIVVNDRLDTESGDIKPLKDAGMLVINFEDLGDGAKHADLVVNAIYPEDEMLPRHYFGHRYFVLRDEFVYAAQPEVRENVGSILLTFGGVDPNNFTRKVLESIHGFCGERGIKITVVAGFGYRRFDSLEPFADINVVKNAQNICEYMAHADVVFTSAGRTTYEVASLGVPCIVLAQNERETTHFFASREYGFENLGMGAAVSNGKILEVFRHLVDSFQTRQHMSGLMQKADLKKGRARVKALINDVLEQI